MLLVIKFAAVIGLVASSANWVAFDPDSKSGYEARSNMQGHQLAFHETVKPAQHNTSQMPFICQNGCNFFNLVSLAH
ncbi:hypothetical protein BH10PSE16_BH10PSE16_33430 [soil metagenome]